MNEPSGGPKGLGLKQGGVIGRQQNSSRPESGPGSQESGFNRSSNGERRRPGRGQDRDPNHAAGEPASVGAAPAYAFFTNSDLSVISPTPSILQSMLCPPTPPPSTRRMFLTFVPPLTTSDDPLTFRSLMTTTLSPV